MENAPNHALYPNPSILSAALATVTSRIKLRAGSVVLPLHDPIRIAEEWSVVDNLSQGRVGIAIASGWHTRDFVFSPERFSSRKQVVLDGIDTLKNLWAGNTIKRKNGMNEEVEIEIFPKPIQKTLPLWTTAAGNPETFIEAGRLGTHVLTHLLGQTIEELTDKITLYRESLAKYGHDPKQGRVTLMIHTFLGEDLDTTLEKAREPFINYMKEHIWKKAGMQNTGVEKSNETYENKSELYHLRNKRKVKLFVFGLLFISVMFHVCLYMYIIMINE